MTVDLRPWRRLLAVWLPAIVLCRGTGVLRLADLGVRRAADPGPGPRPRTRGGARAARGPSRATGGDRARVAEPERQFATLHDEVFGSLDERMTDILRAVGSATRNAGLLPGSYSYTATKDSKTGFIRFGIQFSVSRASTGRSDRCWPSCSRAPSS